MSVSFWKKTLFLSALLIVPIAQASITVPMYFVGVGDKEPKPIGEIIIKKIRYGVLFTPNLHDLPPGMHGFHLHQKPNCSNRGMAAGGHYDPRRTKRHLGPFNHKGHLGDLPALTVDRYGHATSPLLAPRLRLQHLKGRALIIHQFGDNYADTPKELGGGGARIACGIIPYSD